MPDSDEYNGWPNRETWAINLHLSNNEGDYRYMCEQAEELVRDANSRDMAIWCMADFISDWTSYVFDVVINPEDGPPNEAARLFVGDVGSWWRADFREIAEHWIDDAIEAVPADELGWHEEEETESA